jgi:hypothetical protein
MSGFNSMTMACLVASMMAISAAVAESPQLPVDLAPDIAPPATAPVKIERPKAHAFVAPVVPAESASAVPAGTEAGFSTNSPFTTALASPAATSTALALPQSLTYSGGSVAFYLADTGSNKAFEALISNTSNTSSAIYGQTSGSGAGVTGYTTGTSGVAGKFGIRNPASAQPAISANTVGTGPAVLGTITTTDSSYPAIYGQNITSSGYGVGVEGEGNEYGVYGVSPNGYAVYGASTNGYGVLGYSDNGTAVLAESEAGYGLYAYSTSSDGIYAYSGSATGVNVYSGGTYGVYAVAATGVGLYASSSGYGHGITAHSASGIGLYASSDTNYAIVGQSKNTFAVIGEDSGSGIGVYGSSATGYAGEFNGKVGATSYITLSDRNAKTHIKPIDNKTILERVDKLPITSWDFKTDPNKRHVGPMAQDFHAAFGLDGDDDKHINLTDIAGVSLAAIQELSREMKVKDQQMGAKDEEIGRLKSQLIAQGNTIAELKSMAESFSSRMAVLEARRGTAATQTVSLKKETGARPGAAD